MNTIIIQLTQLVIKMQIVIKFDRIFFPFSSIVRFYQQRYRLHFLDNEQQLAVNDMFFSKMDKTDAKITIQ